MADTVIEILVKVKDEAQKALTSIRDTTEGLSKSLDKESGKLLDGVYKGAKKAGGELKQTKKEAKTAKTDIDKLNKSNLSRLAGSAKQVKSQFLEIRKESQKLNGGISRLTGLASGFAGAFSLTRAVQETLQFSRSITEVSTLVDSSIVSTNELQASVLSLSKAYGSDINETAKAMYQSISAGAEAGQEANKLLEVALKTSVAGVTTSERAVDGLTTVINAFGYEMGDATRVADIMFATMKAGKTDIGKLSRFLFQAAPLASAVGVSFEELSAGVITLTKQGTPTSVAMTQIRAAVQGLLKPTGALQKVFNDAGFSSAKMAIQQVGLQKALNIVRDAVKGDEGQIIKLLGSTEALSAVLGTTGDKAGIFAEAMDATTNSAGAMQEAFDKSKESVDFKFKQSLVSAQAALVTFGDTLKPIITFAVEVFADFSNAVSDWATNNQTAITSVVAVLGSLIAIFTTFKALQFVGYLTGVTTAFQLLYSVMAGKSAASTVAQFSRLTNIMGALRAVTLLAGNAFKSLALNPVALGLVALIAAIAGFDSAVESATRRMDALDAAANKFYESSGAVKTANGQLAKAQAEYDAVTRDGNSTLQRAEEVSRKLAEAKRALNEATQAQVNAELELQSIQSQTNNSMLERIPLIGNIARSYRLFAELTAIEQKNSQAVRETTLTLQAQKTALEEATFEYAKYSETTLKTAEQIKQLSQDELARYKANLEGLNTYLKAEAELSIVRRALGEDVADLAKIEESSRLAVADSLKAVESQILANNEAYAKAAGVQDKYSKIVLDGIVKNIDYAKDLQKAFSDFDVTSLNDVADVLNGLARAGEGVSEGLRKSLESGSIDVIREFLANVEQAQSASLQTLESGATQSGESIQAVALAQETAIAALFAKLGVTVQSDLAKADAAINDGFVLMTQSADLNTSQLIETVKSNLSKLSTESGIETFKTTLSQAFDSIGGSTTILNGLLAELTEKQKSLNVESVALAASFTEANKALGVTTLQEGADAYSKLESSIAILDTEFKNQSVSLEQYRNGVVSYLQQTYDYLVNVQGVSRAAAETAVQGLASQRSLQVTISETGKIAALTESVIRAEKLKTQQFINRQAQDILNSEKASMDAIEKVHSDGWLGVSESIKSAFDNAVAEADYARSAMVESLDAYQQALDSGNTLFVEQAKQQYEQDVTNYKQALIEKTQSAQEAAQAQVEAARQAAEQTQEIAKLTAQSEIIYVADKFAELKGLNRDYAAFLDATAKQVSGESGYFAYAKAHDQYVQDIKTSYESAKATVQRYTDALNDSETPSINLINNALSATRSIQILDDESLSGLKSAINEAQQRMQALYETSVQTLSGLQEELLQLQGDTVALENLNYQKRLDDLKAKLEEARATGDTEAIRNFEDAIQVLEEIHRKKLDNIQTEAETERQRMQEIAKEQENIDNQRYERLKRNRDIETSKPRGFATGGLVTGPGTGTSDSILSLLSNGEYVLTASLVKQLGLDFIQNLPKIKELVKQGIPRFATGGLVSTRRVPSIVNNSVASPTITRRVEVTLNLAGEQATGLFSESDADRLTRILESAGRVV